MIESDGAMPLGGLGLLAREVRAFLARQAFRKSAQRDHDFPLRQTAVIVEPSRLSSTPYPTKTSGADNVQFVRAH